MTGERWSAVVLGIFILVSVPAVGAGQGLDAVEERIAAHVAAHEGEALALLERIVEINSGTMNPGGVRAVADVLAAEFEALGFAVRWVAPPEGSGRGGHLVAERLGTRGKRILLIGHLDTVYEEDSPFQRFEREGDRARGPGVVDMKGGDVVIVSALRALHAVGALEDVTIRVVLTGDEESPARPLAEARRALIEAGVQSDVALGFEGGSRGSGHDYGVIARRSSSQWSLEVRGRQAHSSGIFSPAVGAGAIFEAARILNAFYEELRDEVDVTFSPGVIVGGTDVEYDARQGRGEVAGKTNVVAQRVVVHGGIRTLTDEQLERVRARMRAIVARNLPGTTAEITFEDGYPSMPPTEGNRALLGVFDRVSRDLGHGPVVAFDPGRRGAADIAFVARYVDALDGLGPHGWGSHSPEETLDVPSLTIAAQRAAVLIYRLTRGDEAT